MGQPQCTEEIKERMVRYNPQWFREPHALEVDRRQELLWRTARRDQFPARGARLVEDYLSKVRIENQKEKDEIVDIALQLKRHFWSANGNQNFEILQEHVRGVVTQNYHIPSTTRLSPRGKKLPAEEHPREVLHKINQAMRNLHETRSNGIVLLTGGTGRGKSSVIPPALYLDTIAKADRERKYEKGEPFSLGELRPGGKILIAQPRISKALARSMASYLRGLNAQHDHLFGFQHAGHATSSQHDEPVLYMTDGIAVAILMSWVTEVMDLVNQAREPLKHRGG
eukprot:39309-Amphidinium_carterae.1